MHIISKRGNQDNVITYEHICDTRADMSNIERKYITLGSVCIVLQGENDAMEVYMADSSKEWHDIIIAGSSESSSAAGLSLHICTSSEISNGKPNISLPLEGVLYLVPSGNTTGNLYDEYVYVNNQWELFGGASIDLSGYATQSWVQQQGYLTTHQDISGKANSADLANVATSGNYRDLIETPINISELYNDMGYITDQDIDGKVRKVNREDLAAVALSGSYNDLVDAPTNLGDLYNDVGYFSSSEDIINVLNSIDYNYTKAIEGNANASLAFFDENTGGIGMFGSGDFELQGYIIKTDSPDDNTLVISSYNYPILTYEDNGQGIEIGTVTADGTFTALGTLVPLDSNS